MAKRAVEVERLLRWAFCEELPKRQTSSAEGIWDRLAQYGSLGGVDPDPGHGAAQRYAHFGLPHPDAETIEKAVSTLPAAIIDWRRDGREIMGDLIGLIDARRFDAKATPQRDSKIGYRDRYRDKIGWRTETVAGPRDLAAPRAFNAAALVTMHANAGTRPEWREGAPRPVPLLGRDNRPMLIGECKGKNLYTLGSQCPLKWTPSPATIAATRGDYVAWHRALTHLSATLDLRDHDVLPPAAPAAPWITGECEQKARTFEVGEPIADYFPLNGPNASRLPLKPERGRYRPLTMKRARG